MVGPSAEGVVQGARIGPNVTFCVVFVLMPFILAVGMSAVLTTPNMERHAGMNITTTTTPAGGLLANLLPHGLPSDYLQILRYVGIAVMLFYWVIPAYLTIRFQYSQQCTKAAPPGFEELADTAGLDFAQRRALRAAIAGLPDDGYDYVLRGDPVATLLQRAGVAAAVPVFAAAGVHSVAAAKELLAEDEELLDAQRQLDEPKLERLVDVLSDLVPCFVTVVHALFLTSVVAPPGSFLFDARKAFQSDQLWHAKGVTESLLLTILLVLSPGHNSRRPHGSAYELDNWEDDVEEQVAAKGLKATVRKYTKSFMARQSIVIANAVVSIVTSLSYLLMESSPYRYSSYANTLLIYNLCNATAVAVYGTYSLWVASENGPIGWVHDRQGRFVVVVKSVMLATKLLLIRARFFLSCRDFTVKPGQTQQEFCKHLAIGSAGLEVLHNISGRHSGVPMGPHPDGKADFCAIPMSWSGFGEVAPIILSALFTVAVTALFGKGDALAAAQGHLDLSTGAKMTHGRSSIAEQYNRLRVWPQISSLALLAFALVSASLMSGISGLAWLAFCAVLDMFGNQAVNEGARHFDACRLGSRYKTVPNIRNFRATLIVAASLYTTRVIFLVGTWMYDYGVLDTASLSRNADGPEYFNVVRYVVLVTQVLVSILIAAVTLRLLLHTSKEDDDAPPRSRTPQIPWGSPGMAREIELQAIRSVAQAWPAGPAESGPEWGSEEYGSAQHPLSHSEVWRTPTRAGASQGWGGQPWSHPEISGTHTWPGASQDMWTGGRASIEGPADHPTSRATTSSEQLPEKADEQNEPQFRWHGKRKTRLASVDFADHPMSRAATSSEQLPEKTDEQNESRFRRDSKERRGWPQSTSTSCSTSVTSTRAQEPRSDSRTWDGTWPPDMCFS